LLSSRTVSARHDLRLHLADQAGVRAPWLHPNDAGYAAMADTWFTSLTRTVPALRVRDADLLRDLGVVVGAIADESGIEATTTPRSRGKGAAGEERRARSGGRGAAGGRQPVVER
jgi:hypothetical protein